MGDLENVYKLNRYFYMDSNQNILKYKKYCIISYCKKMLHLIIKMKNKLENMINIKNQM